MFRYAQISDEGLVVSNSYLKNKIDKPNMVPIPADFDLNNKKYVDGEWVEYTPKSEPEPEPTEEELTTAELLLNQADIIAKQNEQDEVLAEILLNQMGV